MTVSKKSLTAVEWSLMNVCWEKGTSSARDIWEATLADKKRGYQSVKTMLDRLVEKGYLTREKFGPIWLYSPKVVRTQIVAREIDTFVTTVLDNTVAPLFASLAQKEHLTKDDIEKLKRIIDEHEEEQ